MKYFVVFLILIGFTGLSYFGYAQTSYALTLGMTSEQILETQEIVILGHIESVDLKSDGTQYVVNVLEYIKAPEEFEKKEIINATGCPEGQRGGCHIFQKGENVLFVLNEKNNDLQVSEVSFVAPNPNCEVDDFFALHDAKYGLETSQNNETKKFFTGKPIDITFYAYNMQLDNSPYKITVEFFRAFNNTVFSQTFEGKFEECVPNVKLETSFTPKEMGKYGKRYTASYGGGEMVWGFPIIEEDATPLKQFKAGTYVNEIQCKEKLGLIQKYDGSPACVTESTKQKLVERGWTENESNLFDLTGRVMNQDTCNNFVISQWQPTVEGREMVKQFLEICIQNGFTTPELVERGKIADNFTYGPIQTAKNSAEGDIEKTIKILEEMYVEKTIENLENTHEEDHIKSVVHVNVDKEEYHTDNIVIISGYVEGIVPNTELNITIRNPLMDIVFVSQVTLSEDGAFTESLSIGGPLWEQNGIYSISAQYGEATDHADFLYLSDLEFEDLL
ncbi:MAG: hypothetical protein ACW9W3_05725 [Candidatus Nitrosopumilus sp. bin_68KS]